jgi:hypothetical protein
MGIACLFEARLHSRGEESKWVEKVLSELLEFLRRR